MTATKPLGTYGNAVGTVTPADHKAAQSGLIAKTSGNAVRAGLFWGGTANIITAKPNMSYDVAQFTAALSRGASAGTVLLSNDGTLNVATTAAPGSNSRIDIIYVWAREFSLDGVDSNPVIGVAQGTAAAVPTAPSLAAFPGALEIGRATVGAGITATTSATITQTAPFTATAGGVLPFRNTTERDAGTYLESQLGWLMDTDTFQVYTGAAWKSVGSAAVIPVSSSGSIGADGKVTFSAASSVTIDVSGFTDDDEYEFVLDVTSTSATTVPTVQLRASAANIGGTAYDGNNHYASGASDAASAPAGQASWQLALTGTLIYSKITLAGLGQSRSKIGHALTYSTQNPQTAASLFTEGLQFRSTTVITGIAFIFTGGTATGSVRIRRRNA